MSDFKPIIIEDISLNDFLEIHINKCFYNKFHVIEKKLFNINYDIKKFFNELFSLSSTMVYNYKLKYELFEFLEKYFNELSEDSISETYYKLLLIYSLNDIKEVFYNTNFYDDLAINIIEIENLSNEYQSISSDIRIFLNKEFEKINQNEIKKYFIEVVHSMEIPESILRQITLDCDESYNMIEVINSVNREINIYGIESIISYLYVAEEEELNENQDLFKIIKLINEIIKKNVGIENTINNQVNLIDNITSKDLYIDKDYSFDSLSELPKFDSYEVALFAKIINEKFKHNKSLEQYEICDGLADATGFSRATINQNIKDISTGIKFAKKEKKESLKDKLLLIVNLLNDN